MNHQFKKLGLVGVTWHWLHHASATPLDAVGTPLGTVQALLGHSPSEVTREIYLHSIPADGRTAIQKVGGGDSTGPTGGNFYNNVQIYQP